MSDEGFHEFQLNGKQLVFLFMAATVVAVVIFLCGVMVGRGVPIRAASAVDVPGQASLDPTASAQAPSTVQAAAGSDNEPIAAQETLTYPALLKDSDPPEETLRPPVEPTPRPVAEPALVVARQPEAIARRPAPSAPRPSSAALPATVAPRPAVAPPSAVAAPSEPAPSPAAAAPRAAISRPAGAAPADAAVGLEEPPGAGFVVQVAAVRQRAEANTIARRLSAKGYPAFVTTAGANFRVRVGKYTDRREAESVAGRLEKEERFMPWITR